MCYSAQVSIRTFSVVSAVCIFLLLRGKGIDHAVAALLFFIGFMQLFEYILWTNQECNTANKFISSIIPTYLFFQPAVVAFIVWKMNAGWGTLYPYIILGSVLLFPFFIKNQNISEIDCIKKGQSNHLDWGLKRQNDIFNKEITPLNLFGSLTYYISMLYVFATLKNKTLSSLFVSFYSLSWIISNILYKEVWGSIWCHAVNGMAVVALFV